MNDLKKIVGENLTKLRQHNKMTQSELAEKLNYTDKSISKWEHGEALPPLEVLKEIADLFNVNIDFLITENDDSTFDRRYNLKENKVNKIIITLLAVSLIWLIATILYVYGYTLANQNYWIFFVASVPLSCIVLLVFNGIWGRRKYIFILTSILQWSILATTFLFFLIYYSTIPWAIFFIGIPLQIGIILWSLLKTRKSK